MAKRKVGLLAEILSKVEFLGPDEQKTLSDTLYLKTLADRRMTKVEQPKPERKPSQKRKAGKEVTTINSTGLSDDCTACTYPADHNIHHLKGERGYHEFQFRPAGEASKEVGVS